MSGREDWERQYRAGATVREIAATAGVHFTTVAAWLRKRGVQMRPAARQPDPGRWRWPSLYRQGVALEEIAARSGCGAATVRTHLRRLGVQMRRVNGARRGP